MLLWCACGGRKSAPPLPANVPYRIDIIGVNSSELMSDIPLLGATLLRDDKPLGVIAYEAQSAVVRVTLPSSDVPSGWGTLAVQLRTPCGDKRVPVEAKEWRWRGDEELRELASNFASYKDSVHVLLTAPGFAFPITELRIEWGDQKQPLKIGAMQVAPGTPRVVVADPRCASAPPLALGDAKFGTLGDGPQGFILAQPERCFSIAHLSYVGEPSNARVVKTPAYDESRLEYFLTPPPQEITADRSIKRLVRTSVQAAECPKP
jgi:hypothetical protein